MPTGYTEILYDRNVDFVTFVRHAAKMYCFPNSEPSFEIDPYYQQEVDRLENELREFSKLSDKEKVVRQLEEFNKEFMQRQTLINKTELVIKRYEDMIHQIESFDWPAMYEPFKKFMIDQLAMSIEGDRIPKFIENETTVKIVSTEIWFNQRLAQLKNDLDEAKLKLEAEKHRMSEFKKWWLGLDYILTNYAKSLDKLEKKLAEGIDNSK